MKLSKPLTDEQLWGTPCRDGEYGRPETCRTCSQSFEDPLHQWFCLIDYEGKSSPLVKINPNQPACSRAEREVRIL